MADYDYGGNDFAGLDAGMGDYDVSNFTGTPISWEDQYANLIGASPTNDTASPSPSNAEILKNINFESSDVTNAINKMLGTNMTGAQLAKMAAVAGGGIAGLMGALNPSTKKVGYQGSIPKYDAVRNMVNAPPTKAQGYRPGQGGINYGGDVSYVPQGTGSTATAAQPSQTVNRAPAGSDGLGGQTGQAIASGAGMSLAGLPLGIAAGTAPTGKPVSPDDLFYKSPEFKAYQNDPSNMYATADMYDSPYFGRVSSGSAGRAMDRAYEQYKQNAAPVGEVKAAQGGLMGLAQGRYLQGETDGMADKIPATIGKDQPAALSHGEFVVPADVVSHLGNGNSDAGAKKLYGMMDKIRQARTGTKKQGKQIDPDKFMPGGTVKGYAEGGTTGVGSAVAAGVTGQEQTPNTWAGEYMSDMLGKTQALTNAPYQQYMGPLTAGESGLQSKVFGGLQNANFPSNLGASFSSTGAYQAPNLNMSAYQQKPIGVGTPRPTYDQYMAGRSPEQQDIPVSREVYDAGLAGNQIYNAAQPPMMLNQGSNGLGDFGSMQSQPGQMPPNGLAGLMGRMQQPQPAQPQQEAQNIAQQYMNPYLQSVLTPQMEELRRQAQINNMSGLGALTKSGAFGGGRQAIMESEAGRNLLQQQNKALGEGYANAYDKAMGQFNTEQAQGQSLAKLMSDQGAQQRGIESEGIAADKAAFEEARLNPYKMLQFQQSMLNGMPISATNYNIATPSGLTAAAQGATTVNSLLKNLGLAP